MQGKALVLLAGRSKSGKDFFAKQFMPYFQVMALADRLKRTYADTIGIPIEYLYSEDTKEQYRQPLINFAENIVKPIAGKDVWAKALHSYYEEAFPSKNLLVSDCRYPEEIAYFEKNWKGEIVKVLIESSFSQSDCGFYLDNLKFDVYVRNERCTDLHSEFITVLRKVGL